MLEFQEKRKIWRILYSKVTLFILIILIVFLANSIWNLYKKQDLTKDNLGKTASSLDSLLVREKMLSSEIERLKIESGIEEEIREKYGLVKPGEEVIVVVDESESKNSNPTSSEVGFWQKIVNWFTP